MSRLEKIQMFLACGKRRFEQNLGQSPFSRLQVILARLNCLSGGFNGCSLIDLVSEKKEVTLQGTVGIHIPPSEALEKNHQFKFYLLKGICFLVSWRVDLQNNQKMFGLVLSCSFFFSTSREGVHEAWLSWTIVSCGVGAASPHGPWLPVCLWQDETLWNISSMKKIQAKWPAIYIGEFLYTPWKISSQIIATSHDLKPQKGSSCTEIHLFQGNLGRWNIITWLEKLAPFEKAPVDTGKMALVENRWDRRRSLPFGLWPVFRRFWLLVLGG